MSGSESKFYRRRPGIGWLLALLVVPLLLAVIGWGGFKATQEADDPILTVPSVNPSATLTAAPPPSEPVASEPLAPFGRFSIIRNPTGFTLGGQLPDATQKSSLLESMDLAMPGATIVDELEIMPGVRVPDPAALGGVFSVTPNIPDFSLVVDAGTLTLTGTAPSDSERAAVEAAAAAAWPDVRIVNNITVNSAAATAPPAPPAPPAQPQPGPAPAGTCSSLQADVTGLLRTPITFATDGTTVVPDSRSLLSQVADRLKACPDARVAVVGYTDNTGSDAINIPLSGNRAKSVADVLVSDGIAADRVTSRGAGAANPVAGNDTPQGRAQNRRVEITVS